MVVGEYSFVAMSERRVLKEFVSPSRLSYGNCKDQKDFKPEVRRACSEQTVGKDVFGARSAKIIIIGQPGAGKTSLVLRYCRNTFERNYKTTIGVDFEVEKYNVLGIPFNVQLWDTAGAERFRGVTTAYFRGAQVVMLVFDLCSEESLIKTRDWLKEAQEFCQCPFEIFLVGTKYDSLLEHDYVKMEEVAKQFAAEYKAEYWCTSSKSGHHIDDLFSRVTIVAFENIVSRELESLQAAEPKVQVAASSTLIRVRAKEPESPKRKKKCCPR